MSEMRWDPMQNIWVAVADRRGRGPQDFFMERQKLTTTACPFCYGQESKTPAEIFALRPDGSPPNQPGWRVRVVPNKYPMLGIEGDLAHRGEGLYDAMNGIGAHEVIIETPDHERSTADLSATELTDVLHAVQTRLIDLRRDHRFRYILPFKSHGLEAGATIPHSYTQILALPIIPPEVRTSLKASKNYFALKDRCLLCDILAQEIADGRRIVRNDGEFLAFAPYAARRPFEIMIAPQQHGHDFAQLDHGGLTRLAETLGDLLRRQRQVLRDPAYNFVLYSAPPPHRRPGKPHFWTSLVYDYHWHIELAPRLARPIGLEWGSGFYCNPTAPEEAAAFLRHAPLNLTP
ncbi:MAG: galactose-1-phosphate uridylyltransferase [Desulfuromonadaceae bacterium]|nr:galactose-1-phosphate uridylyltransferase [Desulfuromonadaceae bacterium]